MNYGQLKENIVNLGFADMEELEEFDTIVPNGINRAITEISMSFAPITSYIEIKQPVGDNWDDEAYYEYKMPDDFMKFVDSPVKRQLGEGIYQRFNDFEIENGDTIILHGSNLGTYRMFYVADHEPFTLETDDSVEIPLPLKAHHMLPLLASYYIWLDDDQTKAELYHQQFLQAKQEATQDAQKPRARVNVEWGNGVWV